MSKLQPSRAALYVDNVKDTVQSFWHGMSITLSYMLRRPVTTQYPEYPDGTKVNVKETLPPRYRGFLEVDTSICTGCQACERACPIGCIAINVEKDPANPKQRVVSQFDIDEAKCMFCGLCVEPCPTGSIQHTREFEGTQRSVRNLTIRWADPENPFPVYKVVKGAEYIARVPIGTLVRAKLDARPWYAPSPEFLPPDPDAAKKAEGGAKGAPGKAATKAAPAAARPAEGEPAKAPPAATAKPVAAAKAPGVAPAPPAAPKPAAIPAPSPAEMVKAAAETAPAVAATPAPGATAPAAGTAPAPTPNKVDGQQA